MSEEMYTSRINALKKQFEGSSNEDFIRGVFMDAYKLGAEAGYNKAVSDVDDFKYGDDTDALNEDIPNDDIEQFDATSEMLFC